MVPKKWRRSDAIEKNNMEVGFSIWDWGIHTIWNWWRYGSNIWICFYHQPWGTNLGLWIYLPCSVKNSFLLALIVCTSWLVVETNPYVTTVPSSITYGVDTSVPYRKTHFHIIFFYSIISSPLFRNHGLWLNIFCHIWVVKWWILCIIIKYYIHLYRGFLIIFGFSIITKCPPTLIL